MPINLTPPLWYLTIIKCKYVQCYHHSNCSTNKLSIIHAVQEAVLCKTCIESYKEAFDFEEFPQRRN